MRSKTACALGRKSVESGSGGATGDTLDPSLCALVGSHWRTNSMEVAAIIDTSSDTFTSKRAFFAR